MRIGLQTWGSDGDVLPFLSLAGGLRAAGHDVTLSVTSVDGKDYAALASDAGVALEQTSPPGLAPDEARAFGRAVLRASPPRQMSLVLSQLIEPTDGVVEDAARGLCEANEIVVGHSIVHALAAHAEKRGRRYVSVQLAADGLASRHTPPAALPNLGAFANALLWRLAGFALDRAMVPWINRVRRRAGVAPVASFLRDASCSRELNLVAASPSLVRAQPDWPAQHVLCGALRTPPRSEAPPLPPALERFLSAGAPPVYATLGSMLGVERDAAAIARTLAEAVRRAGGRAVVQTDEEGVAALAGDASVLPVASSPHDAVFPRCAAVVHHGGAGTSHAACRAGVPSVVVPYYLDQGGWAAALERAGVAPRSLRRRALTTARLASRLSSLLADAAMRERAKALGARMRDEDGVGRAVAAIETFVRARSREEAA